jgi:hypothetical protein
VEQIVIRWPSGIIDRLSSVSVDQRVTVVEGGSL